MLHNLRDEFTVLDVTAELLGYVALLVVVILGRWWKIDVDGAALAGEDLGVTVFAQIDGGAVNLVKKNSRQGLEDL